MKSCKVSVILKTLWMALSWWMVFHTSCIGILQLFYKIVNGKVNGFNKNTDGYRLLSEAEWEWLSRMAGKTKQTIFSWGDEMIIPPNAANVQMKVLKISLKLHDIHDD